MFNIIDTFHTVWDVILLREGFWDEKIKVKISAIPSEMKKWVMCHVTECEVMAPKKFRDEIERTVKEAYMKYWGNSH